MKNMLTVAEEVIIGKIYFIRNVKVMIDFDLAELYGVSTGNLNKAVKRNLSRFPEDFMFELTKQEFDDLIFQNGISSWGGRRKLPYAFSEQGVAMLSSVLRSERAILVNIQIIRVFTRLRKLVESHFEILQLFKEIIQKDVEQDRKIMLIFDYIEQLEQVRNEDLQPKDYRRMGFRQSQES